MSIDIGSLKIVHLPEGKDFTDWMLTKGGSLEALEHLFKEARYVHRARSKRITPIHKVDSLESEFLKSH